MSCWSVRRDTASMSAASLTFRSFKERSLAATSDRASVAAHAAICSRALVEVARCLAFGGTRWDMHSNSRHFHSVPNEFVLEKLPGSLSYRVYLQQITTEKNFQRDLPEPHREAANFSVEISALTCSSCCSDTVFKSGQIVAAILLSGRSQSAAGTQSS